MGSDRIWFYQRDGGRLGPFTEAEIYEEIAAGNIGPETRVRSEHMDDWAEAQAHFKPPEAAPSVTSVPQVDRGVRPPPAAPEGTGSELYQGAPARGFREAVEVCLAKYSDFSGRASRSEFWNFSLFSFAAGFLANALDTLLFGSSGWGPFWLLVTLALLVPGWAVTFRRLHDVNRSGLIYVGLLVLSLVVLFYGFRVFRPLFEDLTATGLAPGAREFTPEQVILIEQALEGAPLLAPLTLTLFGYIIFVVVLWCLKGTPGPNRYG